MAQHSLRRAVYSWILLVLVAAGVGWVTSRQSDPADVRPVTGAARFLLEHQPDADASGVTR